MKSFKKIFTVLFALLFSALLGNAVALHFGWNPTATILGVFAMGGIPLGIPVGSFMASTGINWSGVTVDNGAIRDANELIVLETLKTGPISKFHTLMGKVQNGDKLDGIGDFPEVGQGTGFAQSTRSTPKPTFNSTQITAIEKTWALGEWEMPESISYQDLDATAYRRNLNSGTEIADVSNTVLFDILTPKIQSALQRMFWRILWFSDTTLDLQSASGKLTNTVDGISTNKKWFNMTDGYWKKLLAITASNPSRRNIIAANTNSAAATVALNASGAGTISVTSGGSGYAVGDILTITGGTANSLCRVQVATLSTTAVATVTILSMGTGYSTGAGQATVAVTGAGTSCTLNISALYAGGGSGHAVGDVLQINGGTYGSLATIRVTTVSSGVITGFVIVNPGRGYSTTLGAGNILTTTSTNGAGSGCVVNVTALATTTYASQSAQLTNAKEILTAMTTQANLRLRSTKDACIMCTRSMADAYVAQMTSGNIYTEIQWKTIETGIVSPDGFNETITYFTVNGVDVFPIDIWDMYIQKFFDNGTCWDNPHRAVYTSSRNLIVGTPNEELLSYFDIWFSKDDQATKMLAKDKIGALIFDDTLVQVAI